MCGAGELVGQEIFRGPPLRFGCGLSWPEIIYIINSLLMVHPEGAQGEGDCLWCADHVVFCGEEEMGNERAWVEAVCIYLYGYNSSSKYVYLGLRRLCYRSNICIHIYIYICMPRVHMCSGCVLLAGNMRPESMCVL